MRSELELNKDIEPYSKNINEDNKLTDEQISEVYKSLNSDNVREDIESAEAITDSELDEDVSLEEMPDVEINETEDDVQAALSSYVTSDEDVAKLLDIVNKYKAGEYEKKNLYNDLPDNLKQMIDNAAIGSISGPMSTSQYNQIKAARKSAAKLLVEDIINDAKMNAVINDFEKGKQEILEYTRQQSQGLITEVTEDILARIDQLKEMYPDRANELETMKSAFVGEVDFGKLLNILNHTSPNKLNKLAGRLNSEMQYFNTKVNNNIANVKVPDILEILKLLELSLPQYDEDIIQKFVLLICRTIYSLDVQNNFDDFIYIYRMMNSLYRYKFTNIEGENVENDELFDKVSEVLDIIKSH